MTQKTDKALRKKLVEIMQNHPDSLKSAVANEALDYDDISCFFEDLQKYGCVSGMVTSLIYYSDTHSFFDKYYDEINELRTEFEESTGQPLSIESDLKNYLAWFAFEEVARQMYERFD